MAAEMNRRWELPPLCAGLMGYRGKDPSRPNHASLSRHWGISAGTCSTVQNTTSGDA